MATDLKPVSFSVISDTPPVGMYVWPKTGDMPPENVVDPMVVVENHGEGIIEVGFSTDNETCDTFKITGPVWVAAGRLI